MPANVPKTTSDSKRTDLSDSVEFWIQKGAICCFIFRVLYMNGLCIFMGSNSRSIYPIHNGSYGSLAVGMRIRMVTKSTFKYPSNKPECVESWVGGVGFGIPLAIPDSQNNLDSRIPYYKVGPYTIVINGVIIPYK